ncbi:MAG: hypothetical protein ABSE06_11975 [Anaerolineaceae bacterium]
MRMAKGGFGNPPYLQTPYQHRQCTSSPSGWRPGPVGGRVTAVGSAG